MQCIGITKAGFRCENKVTPPERCCHLHRFQCFSPRPLPPFTNIIAPMPLPIYKAPAPLPVYRPASPSAIARMPEAPKFTVKPVNYMQIARLPAVPQLDPRISLLPDVPKVKPQYPKKR